MGRDFAGGGNIDISIVFNSKFYGLALLTRTYNGGINLSLGKVAKRTIFDGMNANANVNECKFVRCTQFIGKRLEDKTISYYVLDAAFAYKCYYYRQITSVLMR